LPAGTEKLRWAKPPPPDPAKENRPVVVDAGKGTGWIVEQRIDRLRSLQNPLPPLIGQGGLRDASDRIAGWDDPGSCASERNKGSDAKKSEQKFAHGDLLLTDIRQISSVLRLALRFSSASTTPNRRHYGQRAVKVSV